MPEHKKWSFSRLQQSYFLKPEFHDRTNHPCYWLVTWPCFFPFCNFLVCIIFICFQTCLSLNVSFNEMSMYSILIQLICLFASLCFLFQKTKNIYIYTSCSNFCLCKYLWEDDENVIPIIVVGMLSNKLC